MPGKHVHFGMNEVFSPPSTPSPSYSVSTLPSTPGPETPPPLGAGSPYHYTPLPDFAVMLQPVLGVGPNSFTYDLTTRPNNITHPTYPISPSFWAQPATTPPVPFMEVECVLLPWKIVIHPQSRDHNFVSVSDFFTALYGSLRLQVTPAELDQVKSTSLRHRIDDAYRRRYKRLSDYSHYENEKAMGPRRVDFLGEYVMFAGLSCNTNGRAQWTLHVTMPRPSHLS